MVAPRMDAAAERVGDDVSEMQKRHPKGMSLS